jgi:hypothetical protein
VLLTRAPLTYPTLWTSDESSVRCDGIGPFDLHVLGTPPAFILSQDQTLRKEFGLTCLGPKLSLTFLPLFNC